MGGKRVAAAQATGGKPSLKRLKHMDGDTKIDSPDELFPETMDLQGQQTTPTAHGAPSTPPTIPAVLGVPLSWESLAPSEAELAAAAATAEVSLESLAENVQDWYNYVRMARNDVDAPEPCRSDAPQPCCRSATDGSMSVDGIASTTASTADLANRAEDQAGVMAPLSDTSHEIQQAASGLSVDTQLPICQKCFYPTEVFNAVIRTKTTQASAAKYVRRSCHAVYTMLNHKNS